MLTGTGIQIVHIAAARDNTSLHHARGEECKCQPVKPGAHFNAVLPGKKQVVYHLQASDSVGVSY
jgi:hypothetical protein